jgi:hypothetical protein
MGKFSEDLLFGMTIRESATDGSDFTNPAADYRRLFLGEDGQLHVKDSAGAVTDPYTTGGGAFLDANGVATIAIDTPPTAGVASSALIYADYVPSTTTSFTSMTSATAPSGTASEDVHYGAAEAWNALANVSYAGWLTDGSALPHWMQYQFTAAKRITGYSILPWAADSAYRYPISWTLGGSTNGSDWTTIDTVSTYRWYSLSYKQSFVVAKPGSYDYYRITVSANGGDTYTGIKFLELFEDSAEVGLYGMTSTGLRYLLTK